MAESEQRPHVKDKQIMIDAHVHIERGPYEEEWVLKFVDKAIETGVTNLYLLEHSHRFREFGFLYSRLIKHSEYQASWIQQRMINSISDYQKLIKICRKNNYSINVKFGLEICYDEGFEKELSDLIKQFDWDFLTGAIHWIDNWGFDHNINDWSGINIDLAYQKYYEKMIKLANSNLFDHLAHPDSIKCFGHYPKLDLNNYYEQIAKILKKNDISAEFSCGLFNNYGHSEIGLNKIMLEIFQKENVKFITASDAHRPDDVGKEIKKANELLRKFTDS